MRILTKTSLLQVALFLNMLTNHSSRHRVRRVSLLIPRGDASQVRLIRSQPKNKWLVSSKASHPKAHPPSILKLFFRRLVPNGKASFKHFHPNIRIFRTHGNFLYSFQSRSKLVWKFRMELYSFLTL